MIEIDELTGIIIDTAISIHKGLGPGLLESVYEAVMYAKLSERGLKVEKQVPVDFVYEGITFKEGFRVDLLVENKVLIELKSVEKISSVHSKQLLTYMRLMNIEVGLLINFGESLLKKGIHRVVNNYNPSASLSEPIEC
ncbi:MAG: GxxExxY protein [Spirochaetota bacterium]